MYLIVIGLQNLKIEAATQPIGQLNEAVVGNIQIFEIGGCMQDGYGMKI